MQYKLAAVTANSCLQHRAACQSSKFLVASTSYLPDVRQQLSVSRVSRSTYLWTRTFSVAGPTVWNSLPDYLRDPAAVTEQFRRDLKACLCHRQLKR